MEALMGACLASIRSAGCAPALHSLALVRLRQGRPAEAEELAGSCLAAWRQKLGQGTASPPTDLVRKVQVEGLWHPDVLDAMETQAQAVESSGRRKEAVGLFRDLLALRERFLGAEHRDTLATRERLTQLILADDARRVQPAAAAATSSPEQEWAAERECKEGGGELKEVTRLGGAAAEFSLRTELDLRGVAGLFYGQLASLKELRMRCVKSLGRAGRACLAVEGIRRLQLRALDLR